MRQYTTVLTRSAASKSDTHTDTYGAISQVVIQSHVLCLASLEADVWYLLSDPPTTSAMLEQQLHYSLARSASGIGGY